jgi:hypothetical protein
LEDDICVTGVTLVEEEDEEGKVLPAEEKA